MNKLAATYIKCIKIFFGYAKFSSVTVMLLELGLPCFSTLLHNTRVRLTTRLNCSVNSLVRNVNCIWHLTMNMCFISTVFLFLLLYIVVVFCAWVCACVCLYGLLPDSNKDWLIDRRRASYQLTKVYLEIPTKKHFMFVWPCVCFLTELYWCTCLINEWT